VQWIGYDQDARKGTTWQALSSLPKATGGSTSGPSAGANATKPKPGKPSSSSGNDTDTESEDDGSAIVVGSHATLILGVVMASLASLVGFAF
jgi:hypothetical protein